MSFTDTLKRSLGFEETESTERKNGEGFNLSEFINSFTKSTNRNEPDNTQQYGQTPTSAPDPVSEAPVYDDYDDYENEGFEQLFKNDEFNPELGESDD